MTTYALTVSTDELGLGVLAGCAVQIDRKRAVMADQYPPVNVLYMMRMATDEDGVAAFNLKPDDSSTYHVCTIWDQNGVPVYRESFSMPPAASPLHDLSEAVIGASLQFQSQGVDIGTPPSTKTINFAGSSVDAVFSGETITVTIDDREYIDQAVEDITAALGNRVRADAAQAFNSTQKRQARENVGIKRDSVNFTTTSTAPGSTATGTVDIASAFNILSITTNYPARVRLYDTIAHRDSDLTRAIGVYPDDNDGCFFEFITTTSMLTSVISRPINGFCGESPVTTTIAYAVTNLDVAERAVTTTFGYLPTE